MCGLYRAVIVALTLAITSTTVVYATSWVSQADAAVIQNADNAYTDFIDTVNAPANVSVVIDKAQVASMAFSGVVQHRFSDKLGVRYSQQSEIVKNNAGEIKALLDEAAAIFEAGNDEQRNNYVNKITTTTRQYAVEVEALSNSVSRLDVIVGTLYVWLMIGSFVMAVGAYVWAFMANKNLFAGLSQKELRKSVAFASLAPFVCTVIAYVLYRLVGTSGGLYTVTFALIILSFIMFARAIIRYRATQKRPVSAVGSSSL